MSFLTPLYVLAGIVAIGLPIVFHMIRRTPQGRVPFSTVMFLDPSPPRVTRRSRIESWLLLALRALALTLLACAFGRPFLRAILNTTVASGPGQRIAVLIDTSASMRRDTLWEQAVDKLHSVLSAVDVQDQVAVFRFDRTAQPLIRFDEWSSLDTAARTDVIEQRLRDVKPTWAATDTGNALIAVAEQLEALGRNDAGNAVTAARRIALISDFQEGSELATLQSYEWPQDVQVTVHAVGSRQPTNAGLHLVAADESMPASDTRVLVANADDSLRETFHIQWVDDDSDAVRSSSAGSGFESTGTREHVAADLGTQPVIDVYVPPGRSRMVTVPDSSGTTGIGRLELTGDDHVFDNVIYAARSQREDVRVVYYGDDDSNDAQGLRYYVDRAFPDSRTRHIVVESVPTDRPPVAALLDDVRLMIVTRELPAAHLQAARRFVEAGGTLLLVADTAQRVQQLSSFFDGVVMAATEADLDGYSMLADVDFTHPVFADFVDARFADFTHIHVWHYRTLDVSALPDHRVLVRFDNGDPALVEAPLGSGRVIVLTTGWNPADSQLALSTKFAPILNRMLDLAPGTHPDVSLLHVGDALPLTASTRTVRTPDGRATPVTITGDTREPVIGDEPGVYRLLTDNDHTDVVVNLAPDESRTAPMPIDRLETFGVRLAANSTAPSAEQLEEQQRQLQARELEQQQKFWRWLILATIVVLFVETWVASRAARVVRSVEGDVLLVRHSEN